jgi:hypothetical protein
MTMQSQPATTPRERINTVTFAPHPATMAGLLLVTGLLTACSTSPATRGAQAESCYRHGPIRTCTSAPTSTPAQIQAVYRMTPPPAGRGRALIVRNHWADAHGHAMLQLDGQTLVDTIPCTVVAVDVLPGMHQLQIEPAASAPVSAHLGSGQLRAWRAVRGSGPKQRGFTLEPIDLADARALVQECRVLGLIDRTSSSPPKAPARLKLDDAS